MLMMFLCATQGLEHLQILDICGSIMDKQIAASIAGVFCLSSYYATLDTHQIAGYLHALCDVPEAVGQLPALREVNKVKVGRGVSGEGVSESVWKDEKLYNFGEEDAGLVAAIIRTNTQHAELFLCVASASVSARVGFLELDCGIEP
eukprot:1198821-Rhodomonas_salina.4